MAIQTTPHTESGQNQSSETSDLEPGTGAGSVGRESDAELHRVSEGAQTATNRGPAHVPGDGPRHHDLHTLDTNLEGSLETRAPRGEGQGISGRSLTEESAGQEKVVADRPDAQAGVNQSK